MPDLTIEQVYEKYCTQITCDTWVFSLTEWNSSSAAPTACARSSKRRAMITPAKATPDWVVLAQDIKMLEIEVRLLKKHFARTCTWTVDYDASEPIKWDTTCGEAWNWYEGGLTANNVRYCHGCGGKIVEVDEPPKWDDEDDADEEWDALTTEDKEAENEHSL